MRHNQDDRAGRGVGISNDTTQKGRDRDILRVAPEKKTWLSLQRVLDRLSYTVSDRYRIRLSIHYGFMALTLVRVTFPNCPY